MLPLWLDPDKKTRTEPEQAAPPAATKCGPAHEYEVLVAEDHPINLKLALALLQAAGCRAHSAENGRKVLAALDRADYDLIIKDSQMPVMTGIEAMQVIRRRADWKSRTPILSLTADAMKGADEYHAMAGADQYMSKPLKSDCFIAAVKRPAERGRKLREENAPHGVAESACLASTGRTES